MLLLQTVERPETKLMYFLGIDKAKFRRPVRPGDTLRFELRLLKLRSGFARCAARPSWRTISWRRRICCPKS